MRLNYDSFKERNKTLESTNRKLLLTIMRISSRNDVINVCKKLKIIKEDYNPKTDKLELMERDGQEEKEKSGNKT